MPLIKLSKSESRRLSIFFICLALAVGAWLFFALGNRYVYQVKTLVNYINFPQNKAFHPLQSDTVKLQVEGTGWQLLFARLRVNPQSVNVNLRELSKHNYVSFSDQLIPINQQLESNQKIINVQPDTLYFDFSARSIKKVPIKLQQNILFKSQYGISGPIKLVPGYVTITGPRDDLAQMDSWDTENLQLKNISNSITSTVALKKPQKANVSIYPAMVGVNIPVDEFTETSIEVPVKILNNKPYQDVKLLPDKITITLMVALNNYEKIDRNDFDVTVNLDNWREWGYSKLPVHVRQVPSYCKIVRIEPQTIDFLIRK
ncbi:MAG TPA: YbbR-like domain-containing protein [Daejeonella sp.]|nr:YbbR-like domain-containing protein [Daejeonella sp.]